MENKRNSFTALCEYASKNNWCWNLFCNTCGHSTFKVAFSKLIQQQHPDDESFWFNGESNSDLLKEVESNRDFWNKANTESQLKLAEIVAGARISEINEIAKFPDWLGYIGLVINHCSDHEARKLISRALIPQFILMTVNNKKLNEYFKKKEMNNGHLSINDLSRIESGKVDLEKPPVPLIFDIL